MLDRSAPARLDLGSTRLALANVLGLSENRLTGLAIPGRVHVHIPLPEGLLARVPRMSHLGLAPEENLAYATAAFTRAAASGAIPRLHQVLPVSEALPWGALVVEQVEGRAPILPHDFTAIARALAALHALPLPETAARAPLLDPSDPIGYLVEIAEDQLTPVEADLPQVAARILADERNWARKFAETCRTEGRTPPKVLCFADTHPGNFRIRPDGSAVLLDVERPVYDAPGLDLGHAGLPTSLVWDPTVTGGAEVMDSDVHDFHAAWRAAVPPSLAEAAEPWLTPYRRLVWLRTTSWACAWTARTDLARAVSDPDIAKAAMARRLARFVDPEMMERARVWWR
jgi:hypothetical protein